MKFQPKKNQPKKFKPKQKSLQTKKSKKVKSLVKMQNLQPRQHIYSPHHSSLVPSILHSGQAFPYTGKINFVPTVNATAGDRYMFFVANNGVSGSIAASIKLAGTTVTPTVYTIPTLANADTAGGPTSGRAMKCGVSIENSTQLLNRGGRVYILNANSRFSFPAAVSAWTAANYNTVFDALVAMPNTKDYDGTHFGGKPKEMYSHVVDTQKYEDFSQWEGTESIDAFFGGIATWSGIGALYRDRPMSTICVLFESAGIIQTYQIAARGSYYTRWPVDTIAGQAQRNVPTASPQNVNSHSVFAGENSSTLHLAEDVVAGGLGASVLPRLMNFASSAVANAGRLTVPALEAGEAALPLLAAL